MCLGKPTPRQFVLTHCTNTCHRLCFKRYICAGTSTCKCVHIQGHIYIYSTQRGPRPSHSFQLGEIKFDLNPEKKKSHSNCIIAGPCFGFCWFSWLVRWFSCSTRSIQHILKLPYLSEVNPKNRFFWSQEIKEFHSSMSWLMALWHSNKSCQMPKAY